MRGIGSLSGAWLGAAAALVTGSASAQTAPPLSRAPLLAGSAPNIVTFRAASPSEPVQSLRVIRQIPVASLRANPIVPLGAARVNFARVFAAPKSPFLLGERLKALPHVEVRSDQIEAVEVQQGLLLHHVLGYRLKPGACTQISLRAQLRDAGAHCFAQRTEAERIAAFSNPNDPHFVSDPRLRPQAIARANAAVQQQRAALAKRVVDARALLADPAKRQALVAQLGETAVSRLATLGDDALKAELLNAGERRIEHVLFVPNQGASAHLAELTRLPRTSMLPREIESQRRMMFVQIPAAQAATAKADRAAQPPPTSGGVMMMKSVIAPPSNSYDLTPQVFLTGFTVSHDYNWGERIETTIDWCFVGCSETYYVEGSVGFSYGFGLRFPIRMTGKYSFNHDNRTATIAPVFTPINGGPEDYAASGLPQDRLFDGKEIVAQIGAHAHAGFDLPLVGSLSVNADPTLDLTSYLPGDFANGQFKPPTPGAKCPNPSSPTDCPGFTKVFSEFDLLGNVANFGVAGIQALPEVNVALVSDSLKFTLHDYFGKTERPLDTSGGPVPIAVDPNLFTSSVAVGDPLYNLSFQITPGIQIHTFIDLEVWSDSWDADLWIPELSIKIPDGGVNFACHADTKCAEYFYLAPGGGGGQAVGGDDDAKALDKPHERDRVIAQADNDFDALPAKWKSDFDARWAALCLDEQCRIGARLVSFGAVYTVRHAHDASPEKPYQQLMNSGLSGVYLSAELQAQVLLNESKVRHSGTAEAAAGWEIIASAVWSKKCEDGLCLLRVKQIAAEMKQAALARQQQNPDDSSLHNQGVIGPLYGKIFQQEIEHSHLRSTNPAMTKQQRLAAFDCTPAPGDGQYFCPADPAPSLKLCQSMVSKEIKGCQPTPPKDFAPPPPVIK